MAFAFYDYCENLRSGGGDPYIPHMGLQFDGTDVSTGHSLAISDLEPRDG